MRLKVGQGPKNSRFPASQLGLALYMFIVGLEFWVDIVRKHFKSSLAVSSAGMIAPFALGAGLGYWFHSWGGLFPERTTVREAMLFPGASMCITAFPMLARIIHYKGLHGISESGLVLALILLAIVTTLMASPMLLCRSRRVGNSSIDPGRSPIQCSLWQGATKSCSCSVKRCSCS